jgi:hypothetical protein
MIIRLIESNGSVKATIPLADIKHVETRTLSYFGEKTHNLYLFIGEGEKEYFMLQTYLCPINMEKAGRKLQELIRKSPSYELSAEEAVFELHPDAAPATDLASR